jgi:hypothetical protein
MPRLTEVQRGQAIALLIQGQRQQQVALQFGVNVFTIDEAFPTTSTVRTKKSEPRLICEKDLSPLPDWKLSGIMCRQTTFQAIRCARQVFFTNESRFTLFRPDGRRRGERFADGCVLERDRFGGGSVMVCGGISHGLKSE